MNTNDSKASRKALLDSLLVALPGVTSSKISGLDAYLVNGRMFACIVDDGVGVRLPAAVATELRFSRGDVVPFQPAAAASTREWIQINQADAAEYEKDLDLFRASMEHVRAAGGR
jgi:hypothetical protein